MNRSTKLVLVFIIFLAMLLAINSGYLYSKNLSLQKTINNLDSNNSKPEEKQTSTLTSDTSSGTSTSTATSAAPLNNRPSSPSDTVTVQAGQTLFTIGQQAGLSWSTLADINGIDPNKIQAGQVIVIPKNNQVNYTVNTDKANSLQQQANSGNIAFRLSPVETSKSDSPSIYGLASTDTFTQNTIDLNLGTAVVTGNHNNKNYTITLSQPITKGAKGIWAITTIKPAS